MFIKHPFKLVKLDQEKQITDKPSQSDFKETVEDKTKLEKTELDNMKNVHEEKNNPNIEPTTSSSSSGSSSSSTSSSPSSSDNEDLKHSTLSYSEEFNFNHLVIFENQLDKPSDLDLVGNSFEEWILRNNYKANNWKMVDVDNFMGGNPFFLDRCGIENILNKNDTLETLNLKIKNFELQNKLETFNRILNKEQDINIFFKFDTFSKRVEKQKAELEKQVDRIRKDFNEKYIIEMKERQMQKLKKEKGKEIKPTIEREEMLENEQDIKVPEPIDYKLDLKELEYLNRAVEQKKHLLQKMEKAVEIEFNYNETQLQNYLNTLADNNKLNEKIQVIIKFKPQLEEISPIITTLSNKYKSKIIYKERRYYNQITFSEIQEINELITSELESNLATSEKEKKQKESKLLLSKDSQEFIRNYESSGITPNSNELAELKNIESKIKLLKNYDNIFEFKFENDSVVSEQFKQEMINNFKYLFINNNDIEYFKQIKEIEEKKNSKKYIQELKSLFEHKPADKEIILVPLPKKEALTLESNTNTKTSQFREDNEESKRFPAYKNKLEERIAHIISEKRENEQKAMIEWEAKLKNKVQH